MKKILLRSFVIFLTGMVIFSSCDREKEKVNKTPESDQTDQEGSSAIDDALEDVNDIISNDIGGGASQTNMRTTAYDLPCGVVKFDSTDIGNGKYKYFVQYGENTACGYKRKSGDVSFALINGNTFADVGAVYSVTFTDYTVVVLATGNSVTVNGTVNVTNRDGHYVWESVVFNQTVVHKLRGQLEITYENGEVRTRDHFQLRTWASDNSWAGLTFTVSGDTLINGKNISETGYTINGDYYYETEILEDLTWENCGVDFKGPYVLTTGHARMNLVVPFVSDTYVDVEAGYDASFTKTNDCNSSAYRISLKLGDFESTEYQLY